MYNFFFFNISLTLIIRLLSAVHTQLLGSRLAVFERVKVEYLPMKYKPCVCLFKVYDKC